MTTEWHHVPGRLRLRLVALKGNEEAVLSAGAAARAIPGVIDARANCATGSLVITYRPERLAPARLWTALRKAGLVSGPSPLAAGAGAGRARPALPARGTEWISAVFLRALLDRLAQSLAGALVGALL